MSSNPLIPVALAIVDFAYAIYPRKRPSQEALQACKIISHRGEHDNKTVRENTMEAFRVARDAGAWGLEMDIRWTKDMVPIVHHDADTSRVFGKKLNIADVDFDTLRSKVPDVPTFKEFLDEFGGHCHLMIELKAEPFPELEKQKSILKDHLAQFKPFKDYHFLALDPEIFETFNLEPRKACLPVATFNIKKLSAIALQRGYRGLSGHFMLFGKSMKTRHEAAGQIVGTGFPASRYCLYREAARGVGWIFTNDAVKLLNIIQE
ncbi:MAG: glycerophosphodiester phosphodiesterase [Pseudomonadota bacterium]